MEEGSEGNFPGKEYLHVVCNSEKDWLNLTREVLEFRKKTSNFNELKSAIIS